MALLLLAPLAIGCGAEAGPEGPAGPDGLPGEQGPPGEQGAPGDAADRIVHRVTFKTTEDTDSGEVNNRALSFTKAEDATVLEVSYFDSFAAKSTGGSPCACRWTLLFNGEACIEPGSLFGDVGSIVEQAIVTSTVHGFCSYNKSGQLVAGPVEITVSVGQAAGTSGCDCQTGFGNPTGSLSAEEIN